jgi:hypothetical protein
MSRQDIRAHILSCIKESGLSPEQDAKQIAELAIDCTLENLIDFVQQLSHKLAGDGLYSHSMTAGIVINKMKEIKNDS